MMLLFKHPQVVVIGTSAMLLPRYCNTIATLLIATLLNAMLYCHAIVTLLSSYCYDIAALLPCYCYGMVIIQFGCL